MTAPISNEPTTTRLHHYAGRYYRVIQMASYCSLAVAHGLTAASEAFAAADDQEAANFETMQEYLRNRGQNEHQ